MLKGIDMDTKLDGDWPRLNLETNKLERQEK